MSLNPFERSIFQLEDFCKDKRRRVYALKGPWGSGKSYLVRHFLKKHRDVLPRFTSYVSVFGLRTVQEVQERINESIQPSRVGWLGKLGRGLGSFLTMATGTVPHLSLKVPNYTNAVFWSIAKRFGLLIIIDDLERSPELKASQLLGLISSITENSQAKVLIVFNEEELSEASKAEMNGLREKVIDAEHSFQPSIRDLVVEYLQDEGLVETVVLCLETKGGPNIRRIYRIKHGLADFRRIMTAAAIPFDDNDLRQVAKLIWLHDVAPAHLSATDRFNLSVWSMANAWTDAVDEKAENVTAQLARTVRMVPNTFDPLVMSYLTSGFYPEASLIEFAVEDNLRRNREDVARQVTAVIELFSKNFRASEQEVLEAARHVFEQSLEKLEPWELTRLAWLLKVSGQPTEAEAWITKHLDAVLPVLTTEARCREYLQALSNEEHVGRVKQRIKEINPPSTPQEIIAQAVKSRSWNRHEFDELCALDDSFYRDWFETADGDVLAQISGLLCLGSSDSDTAEGRLRQKLERVLRAMAGESRINANRIRNALDLEPAELLPVDDQLAVS